jgi:hypothetical protein
MKKIFLDADIIIDYLDGSSKDHSIAVDCLRIIPQSVVSVDFISAFHYPDAFLHPGYSFL